MGSAAGVVELDIKLVNGKEAADVLKAHKCKLYKSLQ